jgi:hypothetical protein
VPLDLVRDRNQSGLVDTGMALKHLLDIARWPARYANKGNSELFCCSCYCAQYHSTSTIISTAFLKGSPDITTAERACLPIALPGPNPKPIFPAKRENLPDPNNFFPVILHREL